MQEFQSISSLLAEFPQNRAGILHLYPNVWRNAGAEECEYKALMRPVWSFEREMVSRNVDIFSSKSRFIQIYQVKIW